MPTINANPGTLTPTGNQASITSDTIISASQDTLTFTGLKATPILGAPPAIPNIMRLYLLDPDTVFAARVNQASSTYPTGSVAFDGVTTGAYTDIEAGMTVMFGSSAGASDYGVQRIRAAAGSAILYIGRSSQGVGIGEIKIVDDAYITVLNDFRVWAKMPHITSGGNIYKDHNLSVGELTGDDTPPVANAGVGFAATIDSGTSKITASWDASTNSFAVEDGASISSYAWDVDDGTITVGSSSTAAITATFPAGFRWVKLTVTDSNGNSHTARMPVYARDPASDTTISAFQIDSHRITPQGQSVGLRFRQDIAETSYPNGTLVMLWEGEPASASDRTHMTFIGWHHNDPSQMEATRTATLTDTVLECFDVAGKLDKLPGLPQEVEGVTTPSVWTEMKTPNMDKYLHYLLHWHSTALELADWTDSGTGSNFPFVVLGSDGESLFDQVDRRAKALVPDYHLTCNRRGQLATNVDPMLQDTGSRTSTVQTTILVSDWKRIGYTAQAPQVHWHRGNAIQAHASNITALFCVAPGETPGQGETEQEQGEQLAQSQSTLNTCEGHRYARINAPQSHFTIELSGSDHLDLEPADMTWVQVTLTEAAAAKRKLFFTDERGLPQELSISYQHSREGLVKSVTLMWERETSGTPAVTYVPATNTYDYPEWNWTWGEEPPLAIGGWASGLVAGLVTIAAFDNNGDLFITTDYESSSPTWAKTALSLSGTLITFVVDAFSPGYTGGGSTINGWILTTTNIYSISDIFGSVSTASQHAWTYTAADSGNMDFSFGVEDWGIATTYNTTDGVRTVYTTNGGTSWSSEVVVSGVVGGNHKHPSALAVSQKTPGTAWVGAKYTSSVGRIYKTIDYGATWAVATDIYNNPDDSMANDIHFPYHDNDDESLCFYMYGDWYFSQYRWNTWKVEGLSNTSVSSFGPTWGRWCLVSSPTNNQRMAMAGMNATWPASKRSVILVSSDGGDTWDDTSIINLAPYTPELHVAIAGDNEDVLFIFGASHLGAETMHYSDDFGATFVTKAGNISVLGAGTFRGICGGPA